MNSNVVARPPANGAGVPLTSQPCALISVTSRSCAAGKSEARSAVAVRCVISNRCCCCIAHLSGRVHDRGAFFRHPARSAANGKKLLVVELHLTDRAFPNSVIADAGFLRELGNSITAGETSVRIFQDGFGEGAVWVSDRHHTASAALAKGR